MITDYNIISAAAATVSNSVRIPLTVPLKVAAGADEVTRIFIHDARVKSVAAESLPGPACSSQRPGQADNLAPARLWVTVVAGSESH
jgi:hypothetical protein